MKASAVSIFCDDIRVEASGAFTIIGILPDNVLIEKIPATLPELWIYTRIVVPTEFIPEEISIFIQSPDDTPEQKIGLVDIEMANRTLSEVKLTGNPIANFISRTRIGGFTVLSAGRHVVSVRSDSFNIISGSLNFSTSLPPGSKLASEAVSELASLPISP